MSNRWAIAVSTTGLGMICVLQKRYKEAQEWFEKSMQLNREVGDTWMVAICHNNLGNAARGLGEYAAARRHYADSLRTYRDYDDRWALALLLEDIAVLAAQGADARSALEQEIEGQLAAVVVALSEDERVAHRTRGRSLDLATAAQHALGLCATA